MDRVLLVNALTLICILVTIFWGITDPRKQDERVKIFLKPETILRNIFAIIFFGLNYWSGRYAPLPTATSDIFLSYAGIAIFFLGVFIGVWAKITMGKVWGTPAQHNKSRQNKLVTTGPFTYTRNPIYVGLILALIGYGVAIQSYFTFLALIPAFYFWNSIKKEEQLLEDIFKKEYLDYKRKVPRLF